jgi:hypothetical protein
MKNTMTGTFAAAAVMIPRVTAPTGALRQGSGVSNAAWGAGIGAARRLRGTAPVARTEPDSVWRALPV